MRHVFVLAAAFACFGSVLTAEDTPPHPDTAGFFEDFSGRLNKDRWYVSDGWTNGDWQDCHWSGRAVQAQGGQLTLLHIPKPQMPAPQDGRLPALCGEVRTNAFFRYGTFEARIRTPRQSGLNASVFTYTGPSYKAPHDEIDIEILTRDPGTMTMNTYVAGQAQNGGTAPAAPAFDSEFHTVGFRWEPDRITWYLDGHEVHRTAPGSPIPDHPQKLYMSFWSTTTLTNWMGKQTARDGMLGYQIDWVAYTPLEASCLFAQSVTCGPQ